MNFALLFALLSLPLIANGLNEQDAKFVQELRKDYRADLYKFLGDNKLVPQLKTIHDGFFACKTTADEAVASILKLIPTFYPTEDKRGRNLRGLASMMVLIDMMGEARGECN